MKGNSEMIALILAFKRTNIFRSGEKKFSNKGSGNFTGVLNRLAGSEAMSEGSVGLLYINIKINSGNQHFLKTRPFPQVPIGLPCFLDYRISFFDAS
jgi:hypothetical protein